MAHPDFLASDTLNPMARVYAFPSALTESPAITASVEVVSDPARFAAMEPIWNDTVDRAGLAYPFLRHEWVWTWWQAFGASRRLHIVVVKSGGRVLAIAPLMWETAMMYGVRVRRLRLLQNDHTPDADVIVADEPETAYRALWRSLVTSPESWDVLLLGEVPARSPTLGALTALAAADGMPTGIWHSDNSPFIDIRGSWDSYAETLSAAFRQNLRNRWKRLSKLGEPALEVVHDPAEIRRACEESIHLEASGWKQRAGTSIESEPDAHRFYRELAGRAADAGWLRLLFLTLNGRRIATAYSASYRDRLLFIKTGYNPDFAKCSPAKVLTHLALQRAFATGLSEVNFLGTAEAWKLEWTSTTRPHDWLFIFGNTFRGRLAHQLKFRIKPALQRLRSGIRQTARRRPTGCESFGEIRP
jgi:CelD/BcsL family acetyltransferase involved in cellulose biosynthesis